MQPRLAPSPHSLIAGRLDQRAAFAAPHGRPDWAISAPSALPGCDQAVPAVWASKAPDSDPDPAMPSANAAGAAARRVPGAPRTGNAQGTGLGLGLRLDSEALDVLRALQPDAAAELEAPGMLEPIQGAAKLHVSPKHNTVRSAAESAQSRKAGRLLLLTAGPGKAGSVSGSGLTEAARKCAAQVAAWWRSMVDRRAAGAMRAVQEERKQAPAPEQALPRETPKQREVGPIAAEEQRFRVAAAAAGAALPGSFGADFREVAADFAEGADGDLAAGARIAAESFDEVLFEGTRVWRGAKQTFPRTLLDPTPPWNPRRPPCRCTRARWRASRWGAWRNRTQRPGGGWTCGLR